MHITRVELTNIKSYAHASIDLRGGVTAIRGHNGAGKSTLLEAIGWALFDYLPYKQTQFVREGENSGRVTVAFISPYDDREYQVTRRCGSRAEWFIYDPQTGMRIDSNVDVEDFLKQHLRIERTVKLDDLFKSALGAPQGTLTADFLETPTIRKKKFDGLLQVEDYRTAADKLLPTANLIKEQIQQQDVRISGLERDAARLEGWRQDRDAAREIQRQTARSLDLLAGELDQVEALLERLRLAQTELAQREGMARVAEATHAAAQQRLTQTARLCEESRAAAQTLEETRADHEAYQRAERERAHAQRRSRERDELRAQQASATQAHALAKRDAQSATTQLDKITQADRRIVDLQGSYARQIELEHERDEARKNAEQLHEKLKRLAEASKRRSAIEQAVAEREREAAQIEALRPLALALDERRGQLEALQALVAQRAQHEKRRAAIGSERGEIATRRETASTTQAKQRQNLRKLEEYRPVAEGLAEREREWQAAEKTVSEVEARLTQHREARKLSGVGNCPFLREPCKNIQQRGENNLAAYFDRLITADEQALATAQTQRDAAETQASRARKAAEWYSRRDEFREQLEQATSELAACEDKSARLMAESNDIEQALAAAGDLAGLDHARRALRESQEADKRLATLPALRQALDEQRARLRELTEEVAELETAQTQLAGAPAALQAAEAALKQLNDPRSEIVRLRALTEARPEVERLLVEAEERRRKAEADLAHYADALAPFARLDEEISALDAEIKRANPGHIRHLQHQRAAEQLAEREREHAAAAESETQAATEAQQAEAALAAARQRFDGQALAEADARAKGLRSEQGTLRETQRHTEARLAELEREIARGEELLTELERARVERGELTEMDAMLKQFRDTVKEAGPLVTKRLLEQISAQANTIFGEIIGDHSAELAWVDDYEIVLRRNGVSRTFALLSGGEQMAAALATRLALLRRLTGLDLAFFDEPTQNMDSERRSALAEQIRRVRGFDQLIVISHDDTFEQGLDSVIHLEKRNGVTVVSDDTTAFIAATPFATGLDEREERFAELVDATDLSALLTD